MWVLGARARTHTHTHTKNNLVEPLQTVSLKESRPQANMHFMWNWKSTLQYVLCFSDPQASSYLRCQFGDMQNRVDQMNFINWELFGTLSTKLPKDTEILFSFHYGKHQTSMKVDQKYKKPPCSHHPDFIAINSVLYDLDFHPFPPSYYFKAQPKHYFISSTNIFTVSLEEFFFFTSASDTTTPEILIIL